MKDMPSPSVAERNQRRKLQFIPPIWPLVLGLVVIVAIVMLVRSG
jgi:hypothetical protein